MKSKLTDEEIREICSTIRKASDELSWWCGEEPPPSIFPTDPTCMRRFGCTVYPKWELIRSYVMEKTGHTKDDVDEYIYRMVENRTLIQASCGGLRRRTHYDL